MKKIIALSLLLGIAVVGWSFLSKKQPTTLYLPLPDYVKKEFHSPNFPTLDNKATQEGFELGRKLFYDKNLSKAKTISCASCHIQAFGFTDTARFSRGIDDSIGDRNSMTLANIGWSSKFFWDGRAASLTEQIHDPVIDQREMGNTWADVLQYLSNDASYRSDFKRAFPSKKLTATSVKNAIEQFVGSIYSFQSKYDDYTYHFNRTALNEMELVGLKLFNGKAQCANCHNTVLLSNHQFMNNGLDSVPNLGLFNATGKQSDRGLMKTPSLRNVALSAPYMHDGRFQNLEEVIAFYNHNVQKNSPNIDFRMEPFVKKGGLGLNEYETKCLISFLHTLTDTTMTQNPIYANPWKD